MIKIELEFPTGAEARRALLDLLQGNMAVVRGEELQNILDRSAIGDEKTAENFATSETAVSEVETPTKKRRTKAEIEADKKAIESETSSEDIQAEEKVAEEEAQRNVPAPDSVVTAKMLQDKAVSVIRLGKKEEVVKILGKFGAQSVSQADKSPLKVEDYAAVMDELNKL